ncbi:MAG: UDP-N-acetylmuramate dehydrogenase [Clostridia bacterium]|nr:UDP-N-acetylmuramate dehydrogenase [Clostridia bacterium]
MYNVEETFKKLNEIVEKAGKGKVERDVPMDKFTTFRIGGPADLMITLETEESLAEVLSYLQSGEVPYFLLGKGSNLLVKDNGYRGVVLKLAGSFGQVGVVDSTLTAGGAVLMSSAATAAAGASLSGLEFASGIPGSIGGGVFMNAGAYDGDIAKVIRSARIMNRDGSVEELDREGLGLSYRHSNLMENGGIVLSAQFELEEGDRAAILAKMKDLNGRRREKQPLDFPSAGSTFKRPEGNFAGKLIQEAGCSDLAVGGAKVSPKHAGFVINFDNATAKDVMDLIELVKVRVKDHSGVELEPEVRIIGE